MRNAILNIFQACLPDNQEISMDDNDLKQMVSILMKRCNDGMVHIN